MGDKNTLISIEVGAPVSITAEVPAESTGRLLDALTDAIRPFTESRGLKADQIRLQRAEVAVEIAKRAHQITEIQAANIKPLGNKFLVPFLEKASLEDPASGLLDKWASLLASAATDPGDDLSVCTSILSEIGPVEAMLLDRARSQLERRGSWPAPNSLKVAIEWAEVAKREYGGIQDAMADYAEEKIGETDLLPDLVKFSELSPHVVTYFQFGRQGYEPKRMAIEFSDKEQVAIDVLAYRNLLKEDSYWEMVQLGQPNRKPHRGTLHIGYFSLTNLGILFLKRVSSKLPSQSGGSDPT
jgi:hypothetical protein